VSFFVPRSGADEAIDIAERPATQGRAFAISGRGVEDVLLIGNGGQIASGDVASDAEWAWVRRSLVTGEPSALVMLRGRRLTWRGRTLVQADAAVAHLAARLRGSALHVEADGTGRYAVDPLGAERLVVSGASGPAVGLAGPHMRHGVGTEVPGSEESAPVEVS